METAPSVTGILKAAASQPQLASQLDRFRRTLTILFSDIKGSTAYFERFGDAAGLVMVHRCNTLLGDIAQQHGGRVVKTIGDSIMAAFDDGVGAVTACVAMQQAVARESLSTEPDRRVSIRIGAHYGAGIVKQSDVFGDVVNVASRVESVATPGQIVVSHALRSIIPRSSPFLFRHLGRFAFKGKADAQDLFELAWNDSSPEQPPVAHTACFADPSRVTGCFTVQRLRSDRSVTSEHEIPRFPFAIGRTEGDLLFPEDAKVEPRHVVLSFENGRLLVHPVADAPVFFSLNSPFRLQHGVMLRLGRHQFEFRANMSALASAAASGATLADLTRWIDAAPAELVSLADGHRYAIFEEQVTLGRGNVTFVFPDDMLMSRAHAKIYHRGEDFFLEDAGSRNGTFVKAGARTPIPIGSVVAVGGQLLRVKRSSHQEGLAA